MNKKIIAIAIAAAMAAPVAMADMKISGRLAGHLVSTDKNGSGTSSDAGKGDLSFGESGASRMQFDGTSGGAFARISYVVGNTAGFKGTRDYFIGHKVGGMKVSFGRMGDASKNIEKDPLITTFLQIRKTHAEAATSSQYGSSGFVNDVIAVAGKAGAMKYKATYNLTNNSNRGSTGHIGVSLTGKAGPVSYFAGYNNGEGTKRNVAAVKGVTADAGTAALGYTDYVKGVTAVAATTETIKESNTKFGVGMKFGAAKVTLIAQNSDKEGTKKDALAVLAQIGMGKGMDIHVAISQGKNDGTKNTFNRLAISKKVNKGFMMYAGYTSSKADGSSAVAKIGVGTIVKF